MDELLPGIDLEMLFEIGAGFRKVRVENFQEIEREFAGPCAVATASIRANAV